MFVFGVVWLGWGLWWGECFFAGGVDGGIRRIELGVFGGLELAFFVDEAFGAIRRVGVGVFWRMRRLERYAGLKVAFTAV